jgi:hypothetical protein
MRSRSIDWSRITSLETWKGLAIESAWRITPHPAVAEFDPTWPLDPGELERVRIFWPTKYQWPPSRSWVEPILHGFRKYVKIEPADIPQIFGGIVLIQMRIRGALHHVAIDYSDYQDVNEECARRCSLYFKMQFSRHGYSLDHIIPGGFISFREDIYNYGPRVRALADQRAYSYDVYGRFGLEFAQGIRQKACATLARQNYFRWEGSLKTKRYSLSLLEIARSRICIDLPGNGDFCFRLIDYLAVGACVVAPRHETLLHVPLIDREHIVYAREDLSDLVDLCRFYLENDDARETVRSNSRAFFDKYLHRDQLAAYYLNYCLKLN